MDVHIDDRNQHKGAVDRLIRLTADGWLLRSSDGRFMAQVEARGRREIYAIRSPAFRDWLIDGYLREFRQVPSDWCLRRARGALEATARFKIGTPSVFVRVGQDATAPNERDGNPAPCFFLDLADSAGRAVEVRPQGWAVVDQPRVNFRRPEGHLPLPEPSREGSIELLRRHVNLSEPDFRLLIVWMAAALRPVGPYPILALHGEQGSAKSTLARVVRLLVDPHVAPLLAQPRKARELIATAVSSWVLAYDNIGAIPGWMSDALCVLSTAGAFPSQPSWFGEGTMIHVQRPVILNGIDELVARGDLGDRSIFLELPTIAPDQRKREGEFWHSFYADYSRILGGLLDAAVAGLRQLPSVRPNELPRMADFAAFAEAVGHGLGWPAGTFLSDYRDNRRQATVLQLEDSPLGHLLLDHARYMNDWAGVATDLLCKLNALAGPRVTASPRWPKSPSALTRELRRIAPQLAMHDVNIVFDRNSERRLILVSTPAPRQEMPSSEENAVIDNPIPPNGLTAMTAFGP
jgi:hypothetical protein